MQNYEFGGKAFSFQKGYQNDVHLRASFNKLLTSVFDFCMEDWYNLGYWDETYMPYTFFHEGVAVANASATVMSVNYNGVVRSWVQIGTVMTHPAFRSLGLASALLEKILAEYKDKSDLIFLFANDDVLEFYPKFGFERRFQYQSSRNIDGDTGKYELQKVDMDSREVREKFVQTLHKSVQIGQLSSISESLIMFYLTNTDKDKVYYVKEKDAFVVAEWEKSSFYLMDVFARKKIDIESLLPKGIRRIRLGYTPFDESGYSKDYYTENQANLFVLGKDKDVFKNEKLMLPVLVNT